MEEEEVEEEAEEAPFSPRASVISDLQKLMPTLLKGFECKVATGLFGGGAKRFVIADGPLIYSAQPEDHFLSVYEKEKDSPFPTKRVGYVTFGHMRDKAKAKLVSKGGKSKTNSVNPITFTWENGKTKSAAFKDIPDDAMETLEAFQSPPDEYFRRFDNRRAGSLFGSAVPGGAKAATPEGLDTKQRFNAMKREG